MPTNRRGIPQRALAIRLSYTPHVDHLSVAATVTNYAKSRVTCELGWSIDADFADIQEAQSGKRQQQADVDRTPNEIGLEFAYRHERLPYRTAVVLSLVGDVTLDKDKPSVHAHVVLGKSDASAVGGHLIEAHVRPTLEVIIVEEPRHLHRWFDPESGLALIDPEVFQATSPRKR